MRVSYFYQSFYQRADALTYSMKSILFLTVSLLVLFAAATASFAQSTALREAPLRLGVVGLVHGHVMGMQEGLPGSLARDDIAVVGIVEPDTALARQYAERYNIDPALFYTDLDVMLDAANPEAVTTFTSTFDHLRVVEAAARRGVHVMVEKPLAVNLEHARRMQQRAEEGGIHVLTNFVTTWYSSNHYVYKLAQEDSMLGPVRKVVVRDGHPGPKEIGVPPEFLEWLLDPVLNGGGALTDFGCYGANLMTWLMQGQRPVSVRALTQQLKTDEDYARVDDEATIVLEYPTAQAIIQASWNWPINRKDMDVYGEMGYAFALNPTDVRTRPHETAPEETIITNPLPAPFDNPLSYLKAVVRGAIQPAGMSSLDYNVIVTEILDAARRSAVTGRAVVLKND